MPRDTKALYCVDIAYLDADNRPVVRGLAVAVRRRILDIHGQVVSEKIRRKMARPR